MKTGEYDISTGGRKKYYNFKTHPVQVAVWSMHSFLSPDDGAVELKYAVDKIQLF